MKLFFDTNVYVAEALVGGAAERMVEATERADWRIYASVYLLAECQRVMTEKLGFSRRLACLRDNAWSAAPRWWSPDLRGTMFPTM